MKLEIEAVFCDVDKNKIREKLRSLGARLIVPERKMVRTVFHLPHDPKHCFARVRDEGDKIVITYKEFDNDSVTGVKEINLIVNDYEDAVELLRVLGLHEKSYEESMRETWELDGAEVCIDTWPWIPTYVEVEGTSVENMTAVSQKLGFNMENALYCSVGHIYELYYDVKEEDINAGLDHWNRIEFVPLPDWLADKKKIILPKNSIL
ncbi:MAG: CYTH domain-containing protein [Candidatus Saccharibacteria bacterium]|nr:CYTH domain-containing protein [Candidatus Saccharibacteria bacterium]MDO4398915.1 CYTH domain-containing protein [Candidatus Saccharibacteria bacterium]